MAELKPGQKPLQRVIRVHGIEQPVIVSIAHEGISFRVKGTQKPVQQGWGQIIAACYTPGNVPSFLMGKAYDFLQWIAKKQSERAVKKAAKEIE